MAYHDESEEDDGDKTAIHELPAVIEEMGAGPRSAALICISGRSIGQMFLVTDEETTIGRAPECSVFLDDEGVSRNHAKIIRQDADLILMDLGSTNGTFAHGERIDVVTLKDGVKVQVGSSTILQFRYQDDREVEFHTLMQTFKTHDPMTGALNKRAFGVETEKEVGFAKRHDQPLSLVMFDLDHFKRVNDTYGHQAGDLVLRATAETVREAMRKEDMFARYGGEEFAAILINTDAEKGAQTAREVCEVVRKATFEGESTQPLGPLTVSIGVASFPKEARSRDLLLRRADLALYEAKRRGRDQAVTWTESIPQNTGKTIDVSSDTPLEDKKR